MLKKSDGFSNGRISILVAWAAMTALVSTIAMFFGVFIDLIMTALSSLKMWESDDQYDGFVRISVCFIVSPIIFICQLAFLRFSWIAFQIERNTYRELKRTTATSQSSM